jgi:hypothetical protein
MLIKKNYLTLIVIAKMLYAKNALLNAESKIIFALSAEGISFNIEA